MCLPCLRTASGVLPRCAGSAEAPDGDSCPCADCSQASAGEGSLAAAEGTHVLLRRAIQVGRDTAPAMSLRDDIIRPIFTAAMFIDAWHFGLDHCQTVLDNGAMVRIVRHRREFNSDRLGEEATSAAQHTPVSDGLVVGSDWIHMLAYSRGVTSMKL